VSLADGLDAAAVAAEVAAAGAPAGVARTVAQIVAAAVRVAARLARAGQSPAAIVEAIERVRPLDERIAQQDADIAARIAERFPR
jgi:hypothetical protein